MSIIEQLGEHNCNLPNILDTYSSLLTEVEDNLKISNKNLEKANVENPSWQHYYDVRRVELHTLVKHMESEIARIRGKLFRSYNETHQRELSDRAKEKYIDNEPAYLVMYEMYLEVKEVYDKYISVVEAFKIRGYALNNIVKLRVASLERVDL